MQGQRTNITLRIHPFLYDWLKEEADKNYRSLNSQIIIVISDAWEQAQDADKPIPQRKKPEQEQ